MLSLVNENYKKLLFTENNNCEIVMNILKFSEWKLLLGDFYN